MSTTTATTTKACASCAHYQATSAALGECRRHAPQTITFQVEEGVKFESRFPSIKPTDWCGEFFAKA
jgi:hypothetical protein